MKGGEDMNKVESTESVSRNMRERHVNIFNVGGKNVVWPPYLLVKEGEEIVFRAINTSATILLPRPAVLLDENGEVETQTSEGVLFQIAEGERKRFRARKRDTKFKKWLKDKKLTSDYPMRGAYPYSVFCEKSADFAEGNSSPVMIFEPPDPPPPPRKI
jgi:hypothetical protein